MQGHNVWILRPFSSKGPRPLLLLLDIIFKTERCSVRRKLKTNSPPSAIFHQHYTNFSCNLSGFSFVPLLHTHGYLVHKNSLYQTKDKFHIVRRSKQWKWKMYLLILYCKTVLYHCICSIKFIKWLTSGRKIIQFFYNSS